MIEHGEKKVRSEAATAGGRRGGELKRATDRDADPSLKHRVLAAYGYRMIEQMGRKR